MGRLSVPQLEILWLGLSSIAFGAYTAVFATSSYILLSRREDKNSTNSRLLMVIILLYCLSTAAVALNFAFVLLSMGGLALAEDRKASYLPLLIASIQAPLMLGNSLIGDALLIWRCYMIWGRKYTAIMFPCLTYLVSLGSYCALLYFIFQKSALDYWPGVAQDATAAQQGAALWATIVRLTFIFSGSSSLSALVATALISGRILRINRGVGEHANVERGRGFRRVALLIIESGMAYTLCTWLMLGLSFLRVGVNLALLPSLAAALFPTALVALVALGKIMHPTTLRIVEISVGQAV